MGAEQVHLGQSRLDHATDDPAGPPTVRLISQIGQEHPARGQHARHVTPPFDTDQLSGHAPWA